MGLGATKVQVPVEYVIDMFPRYQDYNLQGDGSLLIVRQSAREGRSKRTRRCIPDGFSFFFSFFETKRVSIGKLWLVVFLGAVHHRPKIIS